MNHWALCVRALILGQIGRWASAKSHSRVKALKRDCCCSESVGCVAGFSVVVGLCYGPRKRRDIVQAE